MSSISNDVNLSILAIVSQGERQWRLPDIADDSRSIEDYYILVRLTVRKESDNINQSIRWVENNSSQTFSRVGSDRLEGGGIKNVEHIFICSIHVVVYWVIGELL